MSARGLCLFVLATIGTGFATEGLAGAFPERPIKLVVPFSAGGTSEFVLRRVADRVAATLGQPIVIEHRPGGAGGTAGAAKAAPAPTHGVTPLPTFPGRLVPAAAASQDALA